MRRRLYWLAVMLAAAVAAHAAFILFVPSYRFAQFAATLAEPHGENHFFVLSPAQQQSLFPNLPVRGVTGVCRFNVENSDVIFTASLPAGFWVTTVYSDRGKAIYSVNNRQSGSDVFTVSLSRAPGLIESVLAATDADRPEIDSGWTVNSPVPRGLVVVWYPVADAAMRDGIAAIMERSRCESGAVRSL